MWRPYRQLRITKSKRWLSNLSLVALNTVLLRLLFPTASVGLALHASQSGLGVFNWLSLPPVLELAAAVVLLDLIIYLQHRLFHAVPVLWRFHRMHHVDLDFDVTTGLRFHPGEIVLSQLIKFAAIAGLGASPLAVLIFEVVLNVSSMFSHSNVHLQDALDRGLRRLIVTPDMHRVHHSCKRHEYNRNFGFNLSCWDRLLGTYLPRSEEEGRSMNIGLNEMRDPAVCASIRGMLLLPFYKPEKVTPGKSEPFV